MLKIVNIGDRVIADKKRVIIGTVLTIFVASLIVFDLAQNVKYNNMLNLLLFATFIIISIMERDYKLELPDIAIAYFLFSIFAFSSTFWAVDFDLAFKYYSRLLTVTINFIIIYTILKRYKIENTILYGILLGALYNILIGLNIIHPNYEVFEFGRFTGSLGNSNKIAKTMLLSIFASLVLLSLNSTKGWFRVYNYINIILSFYIIILTISKKAIILAPLMILLSFSIKNLKLKNIVIFILLIFVTIKILITYSDIHQLNNLSHLIEKRFEGMIDMINGYGGDASSKERAFLLEEGFNIFSNSPIFGIGLNNARYFLIKYTHNNYLELLIGVGIIGTILFYSIYIITIKKVYKMPPSMKRRYFFIMILVILLLDMATVTYYTKPVLFTLLYIYYVAQKEEIKLCKIANQNQ
jgi:O-antigen ligase